MVQPLGKNVSVSNKVKHTLIKWHSNSTPGIYLRKLKTYICINTCTWMLITALLTFTKNWKQPKCPTMGEWINKLWLIHTMKWYIAIKRKELLGLPWWRSGWESACQRRGHGFEPWSGKIPHAAEQLGLWATTTEPARLEPILPTREAAIVRGPRTAMKSGPHLPQLEKALAKKQRPNTAKHK